MKRKKTSKVLWRTLWKAYDFRKRALRRLRAYHDSLSERTRWRIVLAMLALFALLSLYTVGKSVYGLLHGGGERMEIAPSERPKLIDSYLRNSSENYYHSYFNNYDKDQRTGRQA